jgi:hypothetical protein
VKDAKMADERSRDFENSLNKIVSATDQSGNVIKEPNKAIYEL